MVVPSKNLLLYSVLHNRPLLICCSGGWIISSLYGRSVQAFFSQNTCFDLSVWTAGFSPVHFLLLSSFLEELISLQLKFSSQYSANHTFLLLFSKVRDVKYASKPKRQPAVSYTETWEHSRQDVCPDAVKCVSAHLVFPFPQHIIYNPTELFKKQLVLIK